MNVKWFRRSVLEHSTWSISKSAAKTRVKAIDLHPLRVMLRAITMLCPIRAPLRVVVRCARRERLPELRKGCKWCVGTLLICAITAKVPSRIATRRLGLPRRQGKHTSFGDTRLHPICGDFILKLPQIIVLLPITKRFHDNSPGVSPAVGPGYRVSSRETLTHR